MKLNRDRGIAFISVLLFLITAAVAGVVYKWFSFVLSSGSSQNVRTVYYEVKPKVGAQRIAEELASLGVVSDSRFFYWYSRISGKSKKFRAGDYRFSTKMTPDEVMAILMSGISFGLPLTVPEGYTIAQIAQVLEGIRPGTAESFKSLCQDKRFIKGLGFAKSPHSLEGYLFPDTYSVLRNEPVEEIIRKMVRKYRAVYTPELEMRASQLGMTEQQVITLASIVEKETGAKHERPLIASVFHNRLKKKMRLQSDPTVIYGVKNYQGNITRKHLDAVTPYNTYQISGLPKGPIANPGKEAILAALYPVESTYLYFVSHNDGTHEFSSTYEDHMKAVAK
ncbi:MAG: endolytic transglycosylase MltG, partial [Bdellovibrionota bacterium]